MRGGGAGKRRDAIEPAVMRELKACGVRVWQISGAGLPDLLCNRRGQWMPLEIKSGEKARLTATQAAEQAFPVVRSVDEALNVVGVNLTDRVMADLNARLAPGRPKG